MTGGHFFLGCIIMLATVWISASISSLADVVEDLIKAIKEK